MPIADIFTKEERSAHMAKIKGKNTKPEIIVRKFLFSKGFRYRINDKSLPGTPDIVLPKYKTAIFVHGCFWHGHQGCKKARLPASNIDYWEKKIVENKERDRKKVKLLEDARWHVIVVWQCEIENKGQREQYLEKIVGKIFSNKEESE